MKIKKYFQYSRRNGTLSYAEAFDNVGLLLGDQNEEATGVLVCHDALEM
jgi:putative NIF3 family GTP cyclohydrolase 1 type 2